MSAKKAMQKGWAIKQIWDDGRESLFIGFHPSRRDAVRDHCRLMNRELYERGPSWKPLDDLEKKEWAEWCKKGYRAVRATMRED